MGAVLRLGAGILLAGAACQFRPAAVSAAGDGAAADASDGAAADASDDAAADAIAADGPAADGAAIDVVIADAPDGCAGFLMGSVGTFVVEAQPQLNSTDEERDPSLSPDGTALYLSSGRPGGAGGQDIWVATRGVPSEAFGVPAHVPDLSSPLGDTRVSFSPDMRTVYLGSSRAGGAGGTDVWRGTRDATTDPFSLFTTSPFGAVNTALDDHDPAISSDGRHLYLAQVGGLGDQEIMIATRPSPSFAFDAPVPLAEVNSTGGDADPTLTPDELIILFGSSRAEGAGQSDLWYAWRRTTAEAFSTPAPVPGVNGPDDEADPMLAADGCELYFASNRAGSLGGRDIFRARFQPP